jgi:hypothetical protein
MRQMRLVAILSWYDEPADLLEEAVASLAKLPVDHLVAVDGAYELYPAGTARSDAANADAILRGAAAGGFGVTLHEPTDVWRGNAEVEKRNLAVRLAEAVTDPDDWYLVLDADHVVTRCAPDLRARLTASEKLVASFGLTQEPRRASELTPAQRASVIAHSDHWWGTIDAPQTMPTRMLYRAVRDLRYGPQHWCVSTGSARLWGPGPLADAEDLSDFLLVEHRWSARPDERLARAVDYYERRDEAGVEGTDEAAARQAALAANVARYLNEGA